MTSPFSARLQVGTALTLLAFWASAHAAPAAASGGPSTFTKILVDRDGVVRVTDKALTDAGQRFTEADVDRLRLTVRGEEVPVLLRRLPSGSPDGRFDFEFLGAFPRGSGTYEDEYTSTNVYLLGVAPAGTSPKRLRPVAASLPPRGARPVESSVYTAHHEANRKLIRFSGSKLPEETWFWAEVTAADPVPTSVTIHTDLVARRGVFKLRVRFAGYSHLPADPDHAVELSWNGQAIGKAVWDGEAPFTFERTIDQASLKEGDNTLAVRATGEKTGGIDLVLLDWVEVSYERTHQLGVQGQTLVTAPPGTPVRILGTRGPVEVFDPHGAEVFTAPSRGDHAEFVVPAPASPTPGAATATPPGLRVVTGRGAYAPHAIVVSHPKDLRAPGLGADLVIVSARPFLPAAERLARVRRAEGLRAEVVSVEDVYDHFRDGLFHPEAIRDFLLHAHGAWNPKPRYVLLVGDASWDYKNAMVADADYADWHWSPDWARQVPKNGSDVAGKSGLRNDRLFIPTHQYQSPWGHSASDNYFVAPDGDAGKPLMAIGRLPVGSVAEADAIVDKLVAYSRLEPGSLKSALFITNDEEAFQRSCNTLVDRAEKEGYSARKVYPKREEPDNRANTAALLAAFDEGQAVAFFYGHGGRYIWRTGPPDLKKNHDLFTLEHLDQLHETKGMPVVVSLTCYSAPFDHPIADSIGEKFLRIPGRGAVAVVASTWRNSPPLQMGQKFLEYLGSPSHARIGDAFLETKKGADAITVATYVLLGDPSTLYKGPRPANAGPKGP